MEQVKLKLSNISSNPQPIPVCHTNDVPWTTLPGRWRISPICQMSKTDSSAEA